jgi:hypothetical protein
MNRRLIVTATLALLATLVTLLPDAASAQSRRCFEATGYCIEGPIRSY